jgi:hypothetical protein
MLAALLAAAAVAQPTPLDWTFDSKGNMALEFALPNSGTPTIGVTYFVADSLAARVDFGLDAIFSPSGSPATFSIDLGLRFYQWKRDEVALFIAPSIAFGREKTATDAAEFLAFGGAVGIEYFFSKHMSVGGQLGLLFSLHNLGGPTGSSVITELTTGTTQLFAACHF